MVEWAPIHKVWGDWGQTQKHHAFEPKEVKKIRS